MHFKHIVSAWNEYLSDSKMVAIIIIISYWEAEC